MRLVKLHSTLPLLGSQVPLRPNPARNPNIGPLIVLATLKAKPMAKPMAMPTLPLNDGTSIPFVGNLQTVFYIEQH